MSTFQNSKKNFASGNKPRLKYQELGSLRAAASQVSQRASGFQSHWAIQVENAMTEIDNAAPKRGVPLWAQIIIWASLVGLLVLVGVTLNKRQQGSVQPGAEIPDFTLKLYDGYQYEGKSEIKLSNLRGKVVVLNFWASWCKPCEQEAAELQQSWEKYASTGDVVFLGVDYVDTEPEARVYLQKYGIDFANGPDMATKVSQLFRTTGVPETYFIDQQGILRYVQVGPFTSVGAINAQIDALLP
jgi:cytochrome c biogenesis protein CcmG/thiol:disulfide interchange protein DsbE